MKCNNQRKRVSIWLMYYIISPPSKSLHYKSYDRFCLFLLLDAIENVNEMSSICPMKGLTKGKLNT